MPSVSVIIPTFNAAVFLPQAVLSVLQQTFQDFEIIIVDDGSTDNTHEICERFPVSKVRTIYQQNMGSPAARNSGIRATNAKYIAFLDADDWYLPDKLALQVQALESQPQLGLVTGGWATVNEAGETVRLDRPWMVYPQIDAHLLFYECPLVVHSVLVRRSWLEQVSFFDASLKFVEDWDLWLRLVLAGCKMAWNEALVCTRRMHPQNKSRDAIKTKAGILATLEKAFASPLPPDLAVEKERILAHWYLVSAAGEYAEPGLEPEARADLALALNHDPGLLAGDPSPASQLLVSFAGNVHVRDAADYIRRVTANLPDEARVLRDHRCQMLASAYIQMAFNYNSLGQASQRRAAILAGLLRDPSWLRNRGVVSIAFETVFGSSLAGAVRRVFRRIVGSKEAVQEKIN